MKYVGDTEWTDKLQLAVLAANTQTKKSTSYTPFYLMFRRNFDSSNLLNLVTSSSEVSNSVTCASSGRGIGGGYKIQKVR